MSHYSQYAFGRQLFRSKKTGHKVNYIPLTMSVLPQIELYSGLGGLLYSNRDPWVVIQNDAGNPEQIFPSREDIPYFVYVEDPYPKGAKQRIYTIEQFFEEFERIFDDRGNYI